MVTVDGVPVVPVVPGSAGGAGATGRAGYRRRRPRGDCLAGARLIVHRALDTRVVDVHSGGELAVGLDCCLHPVAGTERRYTGSAPVERNRLGGVAFAAGDSVLTGHEDGGVVHSDVVRGHRWGYHRRRRHGRSRSAAESVESGVAGGKRFGKAMGPTVDCRHGAGLVPGVSERKDRFITEATDIELTALRYAIQRELDRIVYPVDQNTNYSPIGPLIGRGDSARVDFGVIGVVLWIIDHVTAVGDAQVVAEAYECRVGDDFSFGLEVNGAGIEASMPKPTVKAVSIAAPETLIS